MSSSGPLREHRISLAYPRLRQVRAFVGSIHPAGPELPSVIFDSERKPLPNGGASSSQRPLLGPQAFRFSFRLAQIKMVEASPDRRDYLLSNGAAELERLQLQARAWESEGEALLERVGVRPGWSCVDLGCGAMGLLGPLSARAGPSGRVLGVDIDTKQLAAARAYVRQRRLVNVEIEERDAFHTGLPSDAFDLVHARFLAAPTGRGEELLAEMVRLARPGGTVVLQEPDTGSWRCYPEDSAFSRLRDTVVAAFAHGGGDFNAGRLSVERFRKAGLEDVRARAAVLTLQPGDPYGRLPCQFAASLRPRILESRLMTEKELDAAVAACDRLSRDSRTVVVSFLVIQVWARKPCG